MLARFVSDVDDALVGELVPNLAISSRICHFLFACRREICVSSRLASHRREAVFSAQIFHEIHPLQASLTILDSLLQLPFVYLALLSEMMHCTR